MIEQALKDCTSETGPVSICIII